VREKHLLIDNDHFFAKEQRYPISSIDKIYFYYVQTQKSVNFAAAGIDHDVIVRLYLAGKSEPITFNSLGHFRFGNAGKKASEILIAKLNHLCSATFKTRLSKYLTHLHDSGFFTYDSKRIYQNGDVIADHWQFNLRTDRPILRSPFLIFHERKKEGGIFRKTEKCEVETRFDSDVFFSILATTFGLRWG
jgi:hypothetical protein